MTMSGADRSFFRYQDNGGRDPVGEFLMEQINKGEQARITARIEFVESHGVSQSRRFVENLGKGLYVLKLHSKQNNPRVFMCNHPSVRGRFVMLHAYPKKTNKIPAAEADTARKRQKEVQDNPSKHIVEGHL